MIVRFLAVVAAIFSVSAAHAATVQIFDVTAVLTYHKTGCYSGMSECGQSESGSLLGLILNQPSRATLTITDYIESGRDHQKYILKYDEGSIFDSTENINNDVSAALTWNGNTGSISYSFGDLWSYEAAKIELGTYVAPVPLPAGAALLPLGLAALAMFRKRRRIN